MADESYFVFVRFEDSNNTPHVVSSEDIKSFSPVHSSDFESSKTYFVAWQESEGSFDGFFPAKIICMGASLLELKENANAMNIKRMPPNYALLLKQDSDGKEGESKQEASDYSKEAKQKRKAAASSERTAKKRRMVNVLNEIQQSKEVKDTETLASKVKNERSPTKVVQNKQSPVKGSRSPSPGKNIQSKQTPENPSPSKVLPSPGKDFRKVSPAKDQGKRSSPLLPDKSASAPGKLGDSDDDQDLYMSPTLPLFSFVAKSKNGSEHSSNSTSGSSSSSSGSDDSTSGSEDGEASSCSNSVDSRAELMDKIASLKAACSLAEKSRSKCEDELNELKKEMIEMQAKVKILVNENEALKLKYEEALNKGLMKPAVSRNLLQDMEDISSESVEDSTVSSKEKKKKIKSEKPSDDCGLSQEEIINISHQVRDDINGTKLLPTNSSGKICLGNVAISQDKWNKSIKLQSKNSLFVTKLSQAIYGSSQLSVRTVGTPKEGDKQKATPRKVDTVVACLRGKILAENPNFPDVDKAALAAKVVLGRKMQDEAKAAKKDTDKEAQGKNNLKKGRKETGGKNKGEEGKDEETAKSKEDKEDKRDKKDKKDKKKKKTKKANKKEKTKNWLATKDN